MTTEICILEEMQFIMQECSINDLINFSDLNYYDNEMILFLDIYKKYLKIINNPKDVLYYMLLDIVIFLQENKDFYEGYTENMLFVCNEILNINPSILIKKMVYGENLNMFLVKFFKFSPKHIIKEYLNYYS